MAGEEHGEITGHEANGAHSAVIFHAGRPDDTDKSAYLIANPVLRGHHAAILHRFHRTLSAYDDGHLLAEESLAEHLAENMVLLQRRKQLFQPVDVLKLPLTEDVAGTFEKDTVLCKIPRC